MSIRHVRCLTYALRLDGSSTSCPTACTRRPRPPPSTRCRWRRCPTQWSSSCPHTTPPRRACRPRAPPTSQRSRRLTTSSADVTVGAPVCRVFPDQYFYLLTDPDSDAGQYGGGWERVRHDRRAGGCLAPPPRVSVNLVPLLWTGVPTRHDKNICRCLGAPSPRSACRAARLGAMRDSDGGASSSSASSTPGRCPTLHCCTGCRGCRTNAAHAESNDATSAMPAMEREPHKAGPAAAGADMQERRAGCSGAVRARRCVLSLAGVERWSTVGCKLRSRDNS